MAGWIVFGSILALLLFLLFSNVRLDFRYQGGEIFLRAGWLFLGYQMMPEPEKRRRKNQAAAQKAKVAAEAGSPKDSVPRDGEEAGETAQPPEETGRKGQTKQKPPDQESRSLRETVDMVLDLVKTAKKPARLLYRHLWVRKLDFRLVVAREDAAQTAIAYGQMNGWVHGAYGALSHFVRMKKGRVGVQADYLSQGDWIDASFRLTLRPVFALAAVVWFGCGFLRNTMKSKEKNK
ncbi:MAG: hypothetical protein PHE47_09600 [Oscillospiraceae bacterium]|nr:hypothetical protein [Oscillospiraceae bacterium]